MRGLWLKIWIAWAPACAPRSTALAGPPAGETWAPMYMTRVLLDASPVRPFADRRPPHRRRAHGALQLAHGPRQRRDAGAAHRGHRSRAFDARERRTDPRRAGVAAARLRRGP